MKNPYIGPRAFEQEESGYFFGRDEEIRILMGLVMARRIVLFFAKSGVGKSSLIRAGLIPKLTEHKTVSQGRRARRIEPKMHVLPPASVGGGIRSQAGRSIANVFIYSALLNLRPDLSGETLSSLDLSTTLQPLLAAAPTDSSGQTLPSLLVFDQFEELFNRHQEHWQQRANFFQQVNQALLTFDNLRVLFVMREDYIAELIPYADLLPDRLRSRFRMEQLGHETAIKAIEQPALMEGRRFAPGVAESLVNNLSRSQSGQQPQIQAVVTADGEAETPLNENFIEGASVEPVHLQVVCQQLWNKLPPDQKEITKTYANIFGDVDKALINFYEGALSEVLSQPDLSERRVRDWFETELITPARTRGLVYRDDEKGETANLPNDAVDVLGKVWIIRTDKRGSNTWYELAHDRLVEPILTANQQWLAKYYNPLAAPTETWLAAGHSPELLLEGAPLREAERYAEQHPLELTDDERVFLEDSLRREAQLAEEKRLTDRRRRITIGVGLVVIAVLLALTAWALRQQTEAKNQAQIAGENAATATFALGDAERQAGIARNNAATATFALGDAERNAVTAEAAEAKARDQAALAELQATAASIAQVTAEAERAVAVTAEARVEVQAQLVIANALAPHALVSLQEDPERSILLAQQSLAIANSIGIHSMEAENALRHALHTSRMELRLEVPDVEFRGVSLSPDGDLLAAGGQGDNNIRIWDISQNNLPTGPQEFIGHEFGIWNVAFSPDGTRLASASLDGTAKLWDVQSGQVLQTFLGHESFVYAVTFSPDGTQIATASQDGMAKIWNVENGEFIREVSHDDDVPNNGVIGVDFSPDGRRLATASQDNSVKIWDVMSGELLFDLTGEEAHEDWVYDVAFNSTGTLLATVSQDQRVIIWDISETEASILYQLDDHTDSVIDVHFSPNDACLATASLDGTVKIWDINNRGQLWQNLIGHTDWVYGVAFSAEDVGDEEIFTEQCGTRLATASSDGTVRLWNIGASREFRTFTGHTDAIESVDYSPDGRFLVTASDDETAGIWDAISGESLLTLEGHDERVNQAVFSTDGQYLATGSFDQTAKVWQLEFNNEGVPVSAQLINSFMGHTDRIHGVALSPDGTLLATASSDRTARIWDVKSGDPVHIFSDHPGRVYGVTFGPDGTQLIVTGEGATIMVRDVASGDIVRTLEQTGPIYSAIFSNDGHLATISWDTTTKIWPPDLGNALHLTKGNVGRIYGTAFTPDNKQLATAGADKKVVMWDTATGEILRTLPGSDQPFTGVDISPDGKHLAAVGDDGTIRLYLLDVNELLDFSKSRVTRDLTTEECLQYLRLERCPPKP